MMNRSPGGDQPSRAVNWRQVRILYAREMRAALRERSIVINSILIPIFLYPFIMWAAMSGLMFVMGQTEGFVARVAVAQWPAEHPKLQRNLERNQQFELVPSLNPATAQNQIQLGQLDALLEFLPPTNSTAKKLPGNFLARITYNQSKERSLEARERLDDALSAYRADSLRREARRLGVNAAAWQDFTLQSRNVASKKQMGGFILGLIAPVLFVVMVAIGCFYPAVDALAGERERNTWETLISSAASRLDIVTSKYLYVVTFGGLAGLLNLLAILITLRPMFGPLLAKSGQVIDCTIPLAALPVAALAALLLAGFIAAGMMIFAAFARTFKEGQAMITPFYMLSMVPIMFVQAPGLKLSLGLALVPMVNLTLMVREAIAGKFNLLPILITVAVSLALIALCVRLATFILRFEDVVMGSYGGSFNKFFRQRLLAGTRSTASSSSTDPPPSM